MKTNQIPTENMTQKCAVLVGVISAAIFSLALLLVPKVHAAPPPETASAQISNMSTNGVKGAVLLQCAEGPTEFDLFPMSSFGGVWKAVNTGECATQAKLVTIFLNDGQTGAIGFQAEARDHETSTPFGRPETRGPLIIQSDGPGTIDAVINS